VENDDRVTFYMILQKPIHLQCHFCDHWNNDYSLFGTSKKQYSWVFFITNTFKFSLAWMLYFFSKKFGSNY